MKDVIKEHAFWVVNGLILPLVLLSVTTLVVLSLS